MNHQNRINKKLFLSILMITHVSGADPCKHVRPLFQGKKDLSQPAKYCIEYDNLSYSLTKHVILF